MRSFFSKVTSLFLASIILAVGSTQAADVVVMSSGGFYSAMEALGPAFEKASGHRLVLISGSSMGSSPTAIPARLQRVETADILILASTELDKLIAQGLAVKGSRVDFVHSEIGMVVRAVKAPPLKSISSLRTMVALIVWL